MVLLDANAVIWWAAADKRLGPIARSLLTSPETELVVSLLTLFEIELKIRAGKLRVPGKITEFLAHANADVYSPAPLELPEILAIPTGHGDPFDRALVGLGALKGWDILTSDERLLGLQTVATRLIDSRV